MLLQLKRQKDDGVATLGELWIDGVFQCFTLEDTWREEKVAGKTCIPTGKYEIKLRPAGSWHERNKALGFDLGVLHLQDVPGFEWILIHWGNYVTNTDGCILVGEAKGEADGTYAVWKSKVAYRAVYERVCEAILCETVHIEVT